MNFYNGKIIMNTKIKTIFAASLAVFAVSCTDLDVPVDSQYTAYPGNTEAVESKMAGIYYQMRDCFGRRYMEAMALSSDEFTAESFSGNWDDQHAYSNTCLHTFTDEQATIDWMNVLGEGVVKANEVINGTNVDAKYIAAARAIRAYFTFIEMDCFGDAPIVDEAYCKEKGVNIANRQPRAEVAKWIEKELLNVADQLPEETTGENYGKPNKYMAYGLLARLYINWPVYTAPSVDQYEASAYSNEKLNDCVAACDKIISSGKFALGPVAYRFKFGPNNTELVEKGQIKDFIYAMPYHTLNAQGMQYGRSHSYKDIKSLKPAYYGVNMSNSGGGYMAVTPECVARFNLPGDERNTMILNGVVHIYDPVTLLPTDQVCKDRNGNPLVLTQNITLVTQDKALDVGDNVNGWRQGARSIKWFVDNNDFKNGRNQSNDIPLIRYADILMIKAESITRGAKATGGDTPQSLFNQIRSYVSAPIIDHNPSLDEIYEERGREFFDENLRRMDMIRFGHFEDDYGFHCRDFHYVDKEGHVGEVLPNFDKTRRIFPLSRQLQLDRNPTWKQNPGY